MGNLRLKGRDPGIVIAIGFLLILSGALSLASSHSLRRGDLAPYDRGSDLGHQLSTLAPSGNLLGSSPPFLQDMALADDPAEGYVLAFGGLDPNLAPVGYTLAYQGGEWTNLTPDLGSAPPPRWGASLVYDPIEHELVLFGGCQTITCYPALDDTWTFYGGQWHDNSSTVGTPPSARGLAAASWDGTDGMILLFGGKFGGASGAAFLSDTWGFSSNHWTNLTASLTSESPGARAGASMASLNSSAPVLFGGHNGSSVDSDTWSFQGSNWTNLTSSAGPGPPARSASAFAGDPADGELVLFGGSSSSGGYLGDTWTLRGGVWSREAIEGPPGTHGAGMAVDSEDGYVLLYGGSILQSGETGTTNAYWSYHAGVWHLWNPAPAQPFDWLILLFPGLIAVFGTEFYVLRRRQQKRLAALNDLMPQVPSETTWIPTAPPSLMSASSRRAAVIMYAVMAPMVVFFLLVIGTTTQGPGTPNSLGLLIGLPAFLMVLPALLVLGMRGSDTRSIGVSDAGVVVRRAKQELRLPWDYVQPPRINPKGPWVYFGFVLPGRQSVPSGFNATHDQARAILSHPRATVWTIPPPIREALGLATPTQPVVPQPAPGSPGTAPLAGNRKSTPLRVGAMPTYSAGPAAPVPPVMVAPLPGGAPQVRRCPRCSRLSGIRSRFCPNCGQALG